ncbi:MAG: CDGSH iron-sulfur domain-containing protein [Gemmatimonadetes bacterium]|nr:CDGSH iron-sulfur domain-containing protein [Gemmatimonadota bacterium]
MNQQRLSLCSCGQSAKWPVCDGTHKGMIPIAPTP